MKHLILLLIVTVVQSIPIPHIFKKCNRHQPDLNECMSEAAKFNIHLLNRPYKELKLPKLTPLVIPALNIGSGGSAVAVEQHFTDCQLDGFDNADFDRFEFDFHKKILYVNVNFPDVVKKCHYQLNGKVMLLPVVGDGDSRIELKNVRIDGYLNYHEEVRNEKTYLKFSSYELGMDVSHASIHFGNLFDGDKALGDNINQLLNDNWEDVFNDVKDGYSKAMNEIILSLLNNFWSRVSLEEAFDG